jgi:hypothetical protein
VAPTSGDGYKTGIGRGNIALPKVTGGFASPPYDGPVFLKAQTVEAARRNGDEIGIRCGDVSAEFPTDDRPINLKA